MSTDGGDPLEAGLVSEEPARARVFPSVDVASRWFQFATAALEGGADGRQTIERANEVSKAYEESYEALKQRLEADGLDRIRTRDLEKQAGSLTSKIASRERSP